MTQDTLENLYRWAASLIIFCSFLYLIATFWKLILILLFLYVGTLIMRLVLEELVWEDV